MRVNLQVPFIMMRNLTRPWDRGQGLANRALSICRSIPCTLCSGVRRACLPPAFPMSVPTHLRIGGVTGADRVRHGEGYCQGEATKLRYIAFSRFESIAGSVGWVCTYGRSEIPKPHNVLPEVSRHLWQVMGPGRMTLGVPRHHEPCVFGPHLSLSQLN